MHCRRRKRMPFAEDSSACGHEFPRQCLLLRITATCYADWIAKDDTGPWFSQGPAVTGIIRQFWKSFMRWVKHQARWRIVFVQSPSHVWRFATPWTAARQVSLSFTISQILLKLMSIESVMPSNHLILCRPLLLLPSIFPSIRSFPMSQFFASGGQSTGASASTSVLPMNIQEWFPLGWTGWISLQSKGLSRVFSNTIVWKHQFLSTPPSLWSSSHIHTWLLEKP